MVSQDPVALDYTGWQIIERKRAEKGLKTLEGDKQSTPLHRDCRRCTTSTGHERSRENRGCRGVGGEMIRGSICRVNSMRKKARSIGSRRALDRRSFLKCALVSGAALGICEFAQPLVAIPSWAGPQKQDDSQFTVEAKFYEKLPEQEDQVQAVPARMRGGRPGTRLLWRARESRRNLLHAGAFAGVRRARRSRREKAPVPLPAGTLAFSLATAGCNVNCKFCQNWDISQVRPEQVPADYAPPKLVAELAKQHDCPTIAYTYSEPVVFSEYLMDAADAGHEAGVRSVVVSNGYMQEEALKTAYGKMDAVKIDLKAFTESYYKDVVVGELKPVLDSLVTLRKMSKWTEIVYLVVPTLNDSDAEFRGLARWIKTNLGVDVPIHFTQFHPRIPAEEPAHNAGADSGACQGDCRRRGAALRIHRQCAGTSRAKYLLPEVPPHVGGARGVHGKPDADPQGQLPILPAADPWRLARMSSERSFRI